MIVELIRTESDDLTIRWTSLRIEDAGVSVELWTLQDAIKVRGVRISASARITQQVADLLGCYVATPRIVDHRYRLATRQLLSVTRMPEGKVADSTDAKYSAAIDAQLGAEPVGASDLVDPVGKYWVISKRIGAGKFGERTARNYGWHKEGSTGHPETEGVPPVTQSLGANGAHVIEYSDPSQTIAALIGRRARVTTPAGSRVRPVSEVLADSALAALLSSEGPLVKLRYAVQELQPVRNRFHVPDFSP